MLKAISKRNKTKVMKQKNVNKESHEGIVSRNLSSRTQSSCVLEVLLIIHLSMCKFNISMNQRLNPESHLPYVPFSHAKSQVRSAPRNKILVDKTRRKEIRLERRPRC